MKKRKSHAFGKDVYLLGRNKYGELIWLESPSWDCDWYWGFGYVEVYTNQKNPHLARDISSHSHYDGLVWVNDANNKYIYHINDTLDESVLTDAEAWELSDLMKRFYTFRESAAMFGRGNAHFTSQNKHDSTNKEIAEYINQVELPKIFERVIEILSPIE